MNKDPDEMHDLIDDPPDSPNRLHGNYPDSREKLEAEQQGAPYVPKASQ